MATFTFTKSTGLAIPDAASTGQFMSVFGLSDGVTDVAVTLTGLTHTLSEDLEMLLVSPDLSHNLEFWSDVGSSDDLDGDYVVSDTASAALPDGTGIVPGTYKPADYDGVETSADFGLSSVPITHAGPNGSGTFAGAFGSIGGNGAWQLRIADSIARDIGRLEGWGLTITTGGETADIVGTQGNDVIKASPTSGGNGTYSVSTLGTARYSGVASVDVTGDYGNTNLDMDCGSDTITASHESIRDVSGDVRDIIGAGINGGDDTITATGLYVFGDAHTVFSGTLVGGDDIIKAGIGSGTVYGDALSARLGGFTVGGNDRITVSGNATIVGDAFLVTGQSSHMSGGDDVITALGTANNLISGDAHNVYSSGALVGGDDTIHGGGGADVIYGDYVNLNTGFAVGGSDKLYGDAGADTIYGQGGNDLIDGGADLDLMFGESGNDTYVVDNGGDVVDESVTGSNGVDTVQSSVLSIDLTNTTLFKGSIENATLTGTLGLNLTGSDLGNQLTGNAAKNAIDGKNGADTMRGLGGDDRYTVDSAGDLVIESAGKGTDTVYSSADWTLGAGSSVEEIRTTSDAGTAGIDLTGNDIANRIAGNAGVNILSGKGGNDTLASYGGADRLIGGLGADTLYGGAGNDSFVFAASSESGITATTRDQVMDFAKGDLINVSAIDAKATSAFSGNQAFVLDTNNSFSTGEIRQTVVSGSLLVEFNTDADATAEMSIMLRNHGLLIASDFVL